MQKTEIVHKSLVTKTEKSFKNLAFSSSGELLCIVFPKELVVLSWPDLRVEKKITFNSQLDAVSFSPDGSLLAVGLNNGTVLIYSYNSLEIHLKTKSKLGGYANITWSLDGEFLALAHIDPFVEVYQSPFKDKPQTLDPNEFDDQGKTSTVFTSDRKHLISNAYKSLFLWDVDAIKSNKPKPLHKKLYLRGHQFYMGLVNGYDNNTVIGLVDKEGKSKLVVWDIGRLTIERSVDLSTYTNHILTYPDYPFVILLSLQNEGIYLFNILTFSKSKLILDESDQLDIECINFHKDDNTIVAGTKENKILSWKLPLTIE